MALTVFYGPGAVSKKKELLDKLLAHPAQHEGSVQAAAAGYDFLIVVPSVRWAESTRQRIWDATPAHKLSLYPPVFNFSGLINLLYQRIIKEQRISINANMQETLLRFALENLGEKGLVKQTISRGGLVFPNTIVGLKNFILELKQNGVTPRDLEQALQNIGPGVADWQQELPQIFAGYEQMLEEPSGSSKLIDDSAMEQAVIEALDKDSLLSIFPDVSRALVMGFDLYSRNMLRFIEKLAQILPEVSLVLIYEKERPALFGHIEPSFLELSKLAPQVINVPINESYSSEKRRFIQDFYQRKEDLRRKGAFNNIKITQAATRREEVKLIARYLKSIFLQAEEGQPLDADKVCLCFPNLELYAPLINEIFADYGIPYDISIGQPLSQSPVVNTIINMIEMVAANYHRRQLFRFIYSPYIHLAIPGSSFELLDKNLLNSIAIRSFVVEGRQNWIEAIEAELKRLQRKIDEAHQGRLEDAEGEGSDHESLQPRQSSIQKLKTSLESLFDRLESLEQSPRLEEIIRELLKIIHYLQLPARIMSLEAKVPEKQYLRGEFAALQRFVSLLEQLLNFAPYFSRGQLTLSEFLELLKALTGKCRYQEGKSGVKEVRVMGRLEPRGLQFDYFIMAGLVEGEFPHPLEPPIFLRPQLLKSLGLPDVYCYPLAPDLFLFYLYLTEARGSILLTYPAAEGEEPLLPSMVIEELCRLGAEVEIPKTEDKIYSLTELEQQLGKSITTLTHPEASQLPSASALISEETREALLKTNLMNENKINNISQGFYAEIKRASHHDFTPYEGALKSQQVVNLLRAKIAKTVFSVSQLERYANCPFAYFCERLLNIEAPEEFEEEMTPLERGALIHNILFRFYSELRDKGQTTFQPSQAEALHERLLNIAQEASQPYFYRGLLWENQKEKLFGSTWRSGLLRVFIETEAQRFSRSSAFQPTYFEVSFGGTAEGKKLHDPISTPQPFEIEYKSCRLGNQSGEDGRLLLRGKIDRIDIAADRFVVIDYKTSATLPGTREIESGLSLQLPLYLLAASEILTQKLGNKLQGIGACFYQVRDETNCKIKPQLLLDTHVSHFEEKRRKIGSQGAAGFNGLLNIAREFAIKYVEQMKHGHFALAPTVQSNGEPCRYCPYRRLCRVNYEKLNILKVPQDDTTEH